MNKRLNKRLILYSTNTWIAYRISELYYANKHYLWCSPFFDGENIAQNQFSIPPSSTPKEIGISLLKEIKYGDRHSSKIEANRRGIKKGAEFKLSKGEISNRDYEEITSIVDQARIYDFKPLLYVIPVQNVLNNLVNVDIEKKAHPLSDEYIVEELDRNLFDVISFPMQSL